jgi:hypothetical protein
MTAVVKAAEAEAWRWLLAEYLRDRLLSLKKRECNGGSSDDVGCHFLAIMYFD